MYCVTFGLFLTTQVIRAVNGIETWKYTGQNVLSPDSLLYYPPLSPQVRDITSPPARPGCSRFPGGKLEYIFLKTCGYN